MLVSNACRNKSLFRHDGGRTCPSVVQNTVRGCPSISQTGRSPWTSQVYNDRVFKALSTSTSQSQRLKSVGLTQNPGYRCPACRGNRINLFSLQYKPPSCQTKNPWHGFCYYISLSPGSLCILYFQHQCVKTQFPNLYHHDIPVTSVANTNVLLQEQNSAMVQAPWNQHPEQWAGLIRTDACTRFTGWWFNNVAVVSKIHTELPLSYSEKPMWLEWDKNCAFDLHSGTDILALWESYLEMCRT